MNYLPLLLFRGVALYCPERQAPNIVCHSHDRWPCAEAQAVMENKSLARLCSKSTSDMTFINVFHENLFSFQYTWILPCEEKNAGKLVPPIASSRSDISWGLCLRKHFDLWFPARKSMVQRLPSNDAWFAEERSTGTTEQLFSCFLFLGRRDNMSAIINLCHLRNGLKKEVWQWKTLVGIESTGTICNP